jgi:hypothetical protein
MSELTFLQLKNQNNIFLELKTSELTFLQLKNQIIFFLIKNVELDVFAIKKLKKKYFFN